MGARAFSAIVLTAAGLLTASTAVSAGDLITKGDVQARLEAGLSGGSAIRVNAPQANGAPNQREGDIRLGSNFHHYCADDWHVVIVADVQPGDRALAAPLLAQDNFSFNLDGAPLPVTETAIKPVSQPEALGMGSGPAWYVVFGSILSPADLTVGPHTVEFVISGPGGGFTKTDTIFVDPSGTGICLV